MCVVARVGGKASSESHAINCPEGFPARIAMAPGKAPSNTEMRRCMRENAISRSKCGAEAPRALDLDPLSRSRFIRLCSKQTVGVASCCFGVPEMEGRIQAGLET